MIGNHLLRASLSEEMHVRRLPRFAAPARLIQILTLLGETTGGAASDHIAAIAARGEIVIPIAAKYAVLKLGELCLVWERHTEFASYTLLLTGAFDAPFDRRAFEPHLASILAGMPGEIIRAVHIAVLAPGAPIPGPAERQDWFDADEAIIECDVADGTARIVSDFRLHADGYGRLAILDRGLAGDEPAQLVVRLQELGNYRKMALFGLPLAQRLTPAVGELEARLADLTAQVAERTAEDDALMGELTYLSSKLAQLTTETRYRMSATQAYAKLAIERLEKLRIGAVAGHQSLDDFTERRLMPAVRTCDSFTSRLEDLSQRAAWTSELLRTRIDIALAKQNRDLLASMDRRTDLQLRLQQTVEGLSVVAISYYLVALIGYVAAALPGLDKKLTLAVAVPFVVAGVALAMLRVRKKLHD